MATQNATIATSNVDPTSNYIGYAITGSSAIIINIFIMIVLLNDKKLLKQSALVAGVCFSHFLCGFAIGAIGFFRLLNTQKLSQQISAWDCVNIVFPVFFPLAFHSMASMLLLAGIERALATMAWNWYRQHWTAKRAWIMVTIAYVYVLIPTAVGLWSAWVMQNPTTYTCGLPQVFGYFHTSWNFGTTVVAGVIAVTLTIAGYCYGMRRISKLPLLSGERGRLKKQLRLTRAMLTVTCLDFALVVVPNTLSFLQTGTSVFSGFSIASYTNIFYCLNASVSIVSHLAFNSEFRNAASKLLRIGKCGSNSVSDVKTVAKTAIVGNA